MVLFFYSLYCSKVLHSMHTKISKKVYGWTINWGYTYTFGEIKMYVTFKFYYKKTKQIIL